MSLVFECGHCGRAYDLPESKAGKVGRCKRCGRKMFIPTRSTTRPVPTWDPDDEGAGELAAPSAPTPAHEPLPSRATPVVRSGPDAPSAALIPRPRAPKRRRGPIAVGIWHDDRPLVVFWRRFLLVVWLVALPLGGWMIYRQSQPAGAGGGQPSILVREPVTSDPGTLSQAEIQAHIQERMEAHQGRIQNQLDAVQQRREAMLKRARPRP